MQSEINLEIDALSSTGEGIGTHLGLKVFVEGALPGEKVSVNIIERKKKYAVARISSFEKSSSSRVEPPCPVFSECGGCQIMHLTYNAQLKEKRQKVVDALQRIGGLYQIEVNPCTPSPEPLYYRNKIQIPIHWEGTTKTFGFYRKNSHELVATKSCIIQCRPGEKILAFLQEHLKTSSVRYLLIRNAIFSGESLVVFVTNGDPKGSIALQELARELKKACPEVVGVLENINKSATNTILGPKFKTLIGRSFYYETLLGKKFKISASAFFQVNSAQAEHLYQYAIDIAQLKKEDLILDAFCGVGAFALLASDQVKKAYGIECVADAIRDAQENAALNQIENCHFICGKAEEWIHKIPLCSAIFLNPPRKGCELSLLEALLTKLPKTIVYISCDPATLSRDLKVLNSKYNIISVTPFDMFPQTMHVETVALLKQK